jgi:DNA polymerase-3 subunit alpha
VRAQAWARLFPGAYYIEVQRPGGRNGPAADEVLVAASADLAARLGLPLVATHPVQFLRSDDHKAHEARVCIAEGYVLGDKRRPQRFSARSSTSRPSAEMAELFADLPEALQNSVEIARRCNLTVELGKSRLPDFPTPAGEPLDDFLASESHAGLARPLELLYPDPAERESRRPQYAERLDFEIADHRQDGFPRLLPDRRRLHQLGQAQRHAGGAGARLGPPAALVAYSLRITDLDPLATTCCSSAS